jgi:hypothetical protein
MENSAPQQTNQKAECFEIALDGLRSSSAPAQPPKRLARLAKPVEKDDM